MLGAPSTHLCVRLRRHPVPTGPHVQVIWDRYVRAMQEARFSESVGVYIASGLLTYGASQGEKFLTPIARVYCPMAIGMGAEQVCPMFPLPWVCSFLMVADKPMVVQRWRSLRTH